MLGARWTLMAAAAAISLSAPKLHLARVQPAVSPLAAAARIAAPTTRIARVALPARAAEAAAPTWRESAGPPPPCGQGEVDDPMGPEMARLSEAVDLATADSSDDESR